MIETHRAFVNTWECDENAHMNVQFYWKRFGDAARIFNQKATHQSGAWIDRHVLYQQEMRAGLTTLVKSAACENCVIHLLSDGDGDSASATAIDQFSRSERVDGIPEYARPRSLQLSPLVPVNAAAQLTLGRGLVSHLSCVAPSECDINGDLLDQHYIARFSEAAAHLWEYLGVKRSWMHDNNYGSAAVEMKVTRHAPVRAGMMLEIRSWIEEVRAKTFSFRHQVSNLEDDIVVYSGAVTALIMDLTARKAVLVPEQIDALR